MKLVLTLMCCLALASLVRAEQDDQQKHKGKKAGQAQTAATVQQQVVTGKGKGKHQFNATTQTNATGQVNTTGNPKHLKIHNNNLPAVQSNTQLQTTGNAKQLRRTQRIQAANANNLNIQSNAGTTFKARRFQLNNGPNATIKSVTFSPTYRIAGAQNWSGPQYVVFRSYQPSWHDRIWWGSHFNRISLFGGGYYYWDNGYWYPAWGYDNRYQYYPYDGPIYAYNDLPPNQVVANVQAALQAQGYYHGDVDGLLGPLTRAALAGYQRDHGLYTTAAIDRPTLSSLGMS